MMVGSQTNNIISKNDLHSTRMGRQFPLAQNTTRTRHLHTLVMGQ